MAEKIQINIVYSPGTGEPFKIYENDKGVIWNNNKKNPLKKNVGMGWYSIRDPEPEDSILVVEPYCILPRDYEVNFVKRFKHIFTWAEKAMSHDQIKNKVTVVNHPTYHNIPNLDKLSKNWKPWAERKNEIVIIANNKTSQHHSELYSLRVHLADMLNAYSSFEVSWYGQIPPRRSYYKGELQNKEKVLSEAKFSICTENSYDPIFSYNYFTEKMPDVWQFGAIPIYMGCHNINDMGSFNNCYIDLRPLVAKQGNSWSVQKQALNDRITNFNEKNYKDFITNINEHVEKPQILEKYHSYNKVYEAIIDTLYENS